MDEKVRILIAKLLIEMEVALDNKNYKVLDDLSRTYQRIISNL